MGKSGSEIYVGLDLGGTKIAGLVCRRNLSPLVRVKKKTKARDGVEAGLARITNVISSALKEAGASAKELGGITLAAPGVLDLEKGVVLDAPNLGWRNVPVRKRLEDKFHCPVKVMNDVDAGLLGEYKAGAAKGARCALGVFPGTGIGGACVYNGAVLSGGARSCMEIGHIQVVENGPLCGCGRRGCLEAVASRLAISAAAASAVARGEAPHLRDIAGTDLSNIRSSALRSAIKAGDKVVEEIVCDAARWLGIGVAAGVNMLAPDVVVLGGGMVEALGDMIVKIIEKTARKRVMRCFEKSFKVVPAKLGDDAVAIGAASALIHKS